jgi:hypothetical protein
MSSKLRAIFFLIQTSPLVLKFNETLIVINRHREIAEAANNDISGTIDGITNTIMIKAD